MRHALYSSFLQVNRGPVTPHKHLRGVEIPFLQIRIHEVLIFCRTLGTQRSRFGFYRCRVRISLGSLTSLRYFVIFLSVLSEMSGRNPIRPTSIHSKSFPVHGLPRSSPGRVKNFPFSTSYRPTLRSTQPPSQWVSGVLPRR
jgi:hypothetical protein